MNNFIPPSSILMIDIETLSTKVTAEIAQVAAVWQLDGVIKDSINIFTHHSYVSPRIQSKLHVSAVTVRWHEENTRLLDKRLASVRAGASVPYNKLIREINKLTETLPSDTIVYVFGLSFDLPILSYSADISRTILHLPSYRNLACLRTELATAKRLGFVPPPRPRTAHDALTDCQEQLVLLNNIHNFYKGLSCHVPNT